MPDHKSKFITEAEDIVRSMGLVLNNTSLYSAQHSVTKQAMDNCYKTVSSILDRHGEISVLVNNDAISINDYKVELKNPLMRMFVEHLSALEINAFSIVKEMSREKFEQLIDVLNSKPAELKQFGGFAEAVASFNLDNVKVKNVVYRKIEEHEVVVTKDQLNEAGGTAGGDAASIIAFLKGGVIDDTQIQGIKGVASDAAQLSDLILRAAEVGDGAVDLSSGESMSDLVVGCLRRCYDGLASSDVCKTKKDKKDLKKTLLLLEKELLEKMHDASGSFAEGDAAAVSSAISEMQDELEIDALAAEYMKKRNAIDENEKRILRFIKAKGLDKISDSALMEKLVDGGLNTDGWQELLVKSGATAGDGVEGGSNEGGVAVGQLAMMLARMEQNIVREKTSGLTDENAKKELANILKNVDREVQKLVVNTERKINELVDQATRNESDEKGGQRSGETSKKVISRKKLFELLAEIVQELCQPLAVINCSVGMLLAESLGSISESQSEILKLAEESGERLQKLINHLMGIAGVPDTMQPDASVQKSIYG